MMSFYPTLAEDRRDEIMTGIVNEHIGYNNEIVIRRSADGGFAVCIDMTNKRALFSSGATCNGLIGYTIEQDFGRWCDEHSIIAF